MIVHVRSNAFPFYYRNIHANFRLVNDSFRHWLNDQMHSLIQLRIQSARKVSARRTEFYS